MDGYYKINKKLTLVLAIIVIIASAVSITLFIINRNNEKLNNALEKATVEYAYYVEDCLANGETQIADESFVCETNGYCFTNRGGKIEQILTEEYTAIKDKMNTVDKEAENNN